MAIFNRYVKLPEGRELNLSNFGLNDHENVDACWKKTLKKSNLKLCFVSNSQMCRAAGCETCSPQPGRCSTLTIVMMMMMMMMMIIVIIITLKFASPSEQYVDWGNNINYISMRGQNSPPPLNNMLTGVKTSTISPWGGIKIRHRVWTICWLG